MNTLSVILGTVVLTLSLGLGAFWLLDWLRDRSLD